MKKFAGNLFHFSKKNYRRGSRGVQVPWMRQEKMLIFIALEKYFLLPCQGIEPGPNAMQLMLCTKDTLGRTETEKRGRSEKGPDPPLRGPHCRYPTRSLGASSRRRGSGPCKLLQRTRTTLGL